jgi:hypothetical protein
MEFTNEQIEINEYPSKIDQIKNSDDFLSKIERILEDNNIISNTTDFTISIDDLSNDNLPNNISPLFTNEVLSYKDEILRKYKS